MFSVACGKKKCSGWCKGSDKDVCILTSELSHLLLVATGTFQTGDMVEIMFCGMIRIIRNV